MKEKNHIPVRPCTLKDLANDYGVTFKNFLSPHEAEIGPKKGNYYTTLQVKIIYQRIGPPGSYLEE